MKPRQMGVQLANWSGITKMAGVITDVETHEADESTTSKLLEDVTEVVKNVVDTQVEE